MIFDTRQKKVIEANEKQILCLAGAGSSKTGTLIARIERFLNEGTSPEDIIAITLTNMAADEIKKRLGEKAYGMYVGTIHGLANTICVANGINTDAYIANANFDTILRKAMTLPASCFPHVKYVLVDEFQDICDLDYDFLMRINTENFYITADERQAIYAFRGSNVQHLHDFYKDINTKTYFLTNNYRCPPNILRFADSLIASMKKISPASMAVKQEDGYLEECSFNDALEHLEYDKDWGNWTILCRTNNELAEIGDILDKKEIPHITFKKGDLDLIEMEALLKDNRVKVLTVHSAKGLQFPHVIAIGLKMYSEEERKVAYVAATRAEQSLYWCPSVHASRKRHKNRDKTDAGRAFEKAAEKMISFE